MTSTIPAIQSALIQYYQYYSGNAALGCDPTPGLWAGNIFTAADGSKWMVDPSDDSPHPATDGTDVHYLIPA